MKLVSMIDFVLHCTKSVDEMDNSDLLNQYAYKLDKIEDYANFLNQPLNLSMFVPAIEVDGKWEVLEKPKESKYCLGDIHSGYFRRDLEQYQQAKDRVLFEGFELTKVDDLGYYDLRNETAIIEVYNPLDAETEFLDILDNGLYKINDLIKYAPALTAKGQELSGLK